MDKETEQKLIECLDALEAGESLDAILTRYPDAADELRPILALSAQLSERKLQPSLASQRRSRERFLAQAADLRDVPPYRPGRPFLRRLFATLAAAAVVVLLIGISLPILSAGAVPGDPLYGAKRFVEGVRLTLTGDPAARAELLDQFEAERIREIETLLAGGREAEVAFAGTLERIEGNTWVIAGLDTQLTAATRIQGLASRDQAGVGQTVRVVGRTQDGTLTALSVTITGGPLPTPTPTPSPTPKPTQPPPDTPTAAFTQTPRPSATPLPTGTSAATTAPTEPPALIATPAPATQPAAVSPSPTSAVIDDNDDEEEDGDNENGSVEEPGNNDNGDDDANGGDDDGNENGEEGDDENGNDDDSGSDDDNDNSDDEANDNDSSAPGSGDDGDDNSNAGDDDDDNSGSGSDDGNDNDDDNDNSDDHEDEADDAENDNAEDEDD